MARLGRGYPVKPHVLQPGRFIPVVPVPPPPTRSVSSAGITSTYVTARRTGGVIYTSVVCIGSTNVLVQSTGRQTTSVVSSGSTQVSVGVVKVTQRVGVGPAIGRTAVTIIYTPDNGDGNNAGNDTPMFGNDPQISNNQPITLGIELTGHYTSGEDA